MSGDKLVVVGVAAVVGEVVGVLDSKLAHTMVDKSEPVGVGVVASLLGVDNSLADRLVRRLACTSEGRGEGVVVAQGEGEEWRGQVHSGVLVPNARGLVDEYTEEDTMAQLVVLFHYRFLRRFRMRLHHLQNHNL